jgi:oxygen-independent coproporphyrinogen-3 oxidase
MLQAIEMELIQRKDYLDGKAVETVYFGGGTPSLLTSKELERLMSLISTHFTVVDGVEITLESNPDDISAERLKEWAKAGVNRLSIGIQSFKPSDLEWMNRAHNVKEASDCIQLAQSEGFDNITVDLIYGLPGLTLEEWQDHIHKVIDFKVPHVSAYCLTVEENTALSNWVSKGKIMPANEDQQSDQFQMLQRILEENGFSQYEISNFSKPGYESKHNSNYWKAKWYLGIGPSAHSFNGSSRQWNVANNQKYMKGVESNGTYFELETLSSTDQFNELILTGLRTVYGVNLELLESKKPLTKHFNQKCDSFEENGWMTRSKNSIKLTRSGRLKADFIASELFTVED